MKRRSEFRSACGATQGFTTIELITVVVILGILAVVALPRLNNVDNKALVFHDAVVSALRYAQKTAVSHRRNVCVSFPSAIQMKLMIASASGSAQGCDTNLPVPGTNANTVTSTDAQNALFSPVPGAIVFAPDGTSGGAAISFANQKASAITVVGTTGYVN